MEHNSLKPINKQQQLAVRMFCIALISIVILAMTFRSTSSADVDMVIPVAFGTVSKTPKYNADNASQNTQSNTNSNTNSAGKLTVLDNKKIWRTQTSVDIFEHGDVHVENGGDDSMHIIAPGTSNDYTFGIQNDKKYWFDYTVEITSEEDSIYSLPVMIQVISPSGSMLTNGWVKIDEMTDIKTTGSVNAKCRDDFTIRWKWDFERDDDIYDTMLGDTAVDEILACYVNISVYSQEKLDSDGDKIPGDKEKNVDNSKTPHTGVGTKIMYGVLASLIVLLIMSIFLYWKNRKDEKSVEESSGADKKC